MKRLVILVSLYGLSACQFDAVNPTCYECQLLSTKSGKQTKTFCNKAEMDRFIADWKTDPAITYMCRNK